MRIALLLLTVALALSGVALIATWLLGDGVWQQDGAADDADANTEAGAAAEDVRVADASPRAPDWHDEPVATDTLERAHPDDATAQAQAAAEELPHELMAQQGLEALRSLFPAADEAQAEVLEHAAAGRWDRAVMVCEAYGIYEPYGVAKPLVRYLMTLRAAALYIKAHDSERRRRVLRDFAQRADLALPLAHAALYSDDTEEILAGLRALQHVTPADAPASLIAQVEALTEHEDERVANTYAPEILQWLRGDGDPSLPSYRSSIGHGGSFGGGGASSGYSIGPLYRRPQPPDGVDAEAYAPADLQALTEAYRSGNEEERIRVGYIVAVNGWPEAAPLAIDMLSDPSATVRQFGVVALLKIGCDDSVDALLRRYSQFSSAKRQWIVLQWLNSFEPGRQLERLIITVLSEPSEPQLIRRVFNRLAYDDVELSAPIQRQLIEMVVDANFGESLLTDALDTLWTKARRAEREDAFTHITRVAGPDRYQEVLSWLTLRSRRATHAYEDHVVTLWIRVLDRPETEFRKQAVQELPRWYGPRVHAVFAGRILRGEPGEVVAAMVHRLRRNRLAAWPCVRRLVDSVARTRLGDEEVERAALLFLHGTDAQMLPTVHVLLAESPYTDSREYTLRIIRHYGDVRSVPDLLAYVGDPDEWVVHATLHALEALLERNPLRWRSHAARLPATALDEPRYRRIPEQEEWISLWLARVDAGDLQAAGALAARYPRLELPATQEEALSGPLLATTLSQQLGIPISTEQVAAPPTPAADEWVEQEHNGARYRIPNLFWRHILKPLRERKQEKPPLPQRYYKGPAEQD